MPPWTGIKAKRSHIVKRGSLPFGWTLALFITTVLGSRPVRCEDLLDIEAKTYDLRVVRKSKSEKVYLFNDTQNAKPPIGRILLLKLDGKPSMAFRVLRNYSEEKQFAAKRVRTYPGTQALVPGTTYLAVEKISDIVPAPPTQEEKADLRELEEATAASKSPSQEYLPEEVLAYDPELDAGSSPPPGEMASDMDASHSNNSGEEGLDEDQVSVEEIEPLDNDNHWLTFTIGFIRNTPPDPISSGYFTAGGLRYAYTIKKTPYFKKAKLQDSIALEGSVLYYTISNLVGNGSSSGLGDSYSIMPLLLTLRYNLLVSDSLGTFVYAGAGKNLMLASSNATDEAISSLSSFLPAIGAGLIYRIGPSWDVRFDLGFDVLSAGLMLRF